MWIAISNSVSQYHGRVVGIRGIIRSATIMDAGFYEFMSSCTFDPGVVRCRPVSGGWEENGRRRTYPTGKDVKFKVVLDT